MKLRAKALDNLAPPDWLGEEGRLFWIKHQEGLRANHLLTAQTADSFASLCDVWDRFRSFQGEATSRLYLDTHKQFTVLAKLFRLVPTEIPKLKESRFEDFGEVPIE